MELLSTIKLPKNMKLLTDRLPKANYQSTQQQLSGDGVPITVSHEKQLSEVPSSKSLNKDSGMPKNRSRRPLQHGVLDSEQESTTRSDNSRSVSERNLKRNASENLKPLRASGISDSSVDLMVGGSGLIGAENPRLRDKNSQDYLETIRENEQHVMRGGGGNGRRKLQPQGAVSIGKYAADKYDESDDSYEQLPQYK
jgi:hypothetical protein